MTPAPSQALSSENADAALAKPERFHGVVSSYCPIKGFGNVKLVGAQQRCMPGVALHRPEAEKAEASVGAHITFAVRTGANGRREACDITVLVKGIPARDFVSKLMKADVDWDKIYTGTVNWVPGESSLPASMKRKGWEGGFVECAETFAMFGLDVWVWPHHLAGCRKGDTVRFRVQIDHYWSWPTATFFARVPRSSDGEALPEGGPSPARMSGVAAAAPSRPASEKPADRTPSVLAPSDAEGSTLAPETNEEEEGSGTSEGGETGRPSGGGGAPGQEEGSGTSEGGEAGRPSSGGGAPGQEPAEPAAAQRSGSPPRAARRAWTRYSLPDGRGFWWFCEADGDWFLEGDPGPWTRYADPDSGRHYWWKSDGKCFWT